MEIGKKSEHNKRVMERFKDNEWFLNQFPSQKNLNISRKLKIKTISSARLEQLRILQGVSKWISFENQISSFYRYLYKNMPIDC